MALTATTKAGPTGVPVVDALTNGTYWVLGSNRVLTWALADQPNDWAWNLSGAAIMTQAMGQVLAQYAEVANVKFQYSGWFANLTTAPADLVLAATQLPFTQGMSATTYARAYFPNEAMSDGEIAGRFGSAAVYPNASGDVVLNFTNAEMLLNSYLPGSQGFFALMHETGHALGLKHPHDNGGTPGRPTFQQLGYSPADTQILTIMSYNPATTLAAWLQQYGLPANTGYPQTLMPLDVLAIQSIYGPNTTTRAGNDTYQLFNDNAIQTFWDAGGTDTLTAAASAFGWKILAVGTGPEGNLVVATPIDWTASTGKFYFNIERLEGSEWADQLIGSEANNTLLGRGGNDSLGGSGGNDVIDGGGGLDTAVYTGALASYALARSAGGWTIQDRRGVEGTDSLANVERLYFSNISVALDTQAGGNANNAALALRAILGPSAMHDPSLAGIALWAMDIGMSVGDLVAAAIGTPQFLALAGSRSNADFVRAVYQNVVGVAPGAADLAYFAGLLDSGQFTQASLGLLAATIDVNAFSADLTGVVQTGLEFFYPAGM